MDDFVLGVGCFGELFADVLVPQNLKEIVELVRWMSECNSGPSRYRGCDDHCCFVKLENTVQRVLGMSLMKCGQPENFLLTCSQRVFM